jgi:hypothetical protein
MSNHTPGPWAAGRKDMASFIESNPGKWIYADGNDYIAAAVMDKEKPWDEVMANAHLIAAAPEMLKALEQIQKFLTAGNQGVHEDRVITDALEVCGEAIKKARSEE